MRRRSVMEGGEYDRMPPRPMIDLTRQAANVAHMGWANEMTRMVASTMRQGVCPVCKQKIGRGIVVHVAACEG